MKRKNTILKTEELKKANDQIVAWFEKNQMNFIVTGLVFMYLNIGSVLFHCAKQNPQILSNLDQFMGCW